MNTRAKTLSFLVLLGAMSGCSTPVHHVGGEEPVYLGPMAVQIPREYLPRYACLTGHPVVCECGGRVSRTCLCRCGI